MFSRIFQRQRGWKEITTEREFANSRLSVETRNAVKCGARCSTGRPTCFGRTKKNKNFLDGDTTTVSWLYAKAERRNEATWRMTTVTTKGTRNAIRQKAWSIRKGGQGQIGQRNHSTTRHNDLKLLPLLLVLLLYSSDSCTFRACCGCREQSGRKDDNATIIERIARQSTQERTLQPPHF